MPRGMHGSQVQAAIAAASIQETEATISHLHEEISGWNLIWTCLRPVISSISFVHCFYLCTFVLSLIFYTYKTKANALVLQLKKELICQELDKLLRFEDIHQKHQLLSLLLSWNQNMELYWSNQRKSCINSPNLLVSAMVMLYMKFIILAGMAVI